MKKNNTSTLIPGVKVFNNEMTAHFEPSFFIYTIDCFDNNSIITDTNCIAEQMFTN